MGGQLKQEAEYLKDQVKHELSPSGGSGWIVVAMIWLFIVLGIVCAFAMMLTGGG